MAARQSGKRSGGNKGRSGIPCLDRLWEISIRRRDNPNVHLHGPIAAHRFKLTLLKNAQQLDLRAKRQLADFIEKDRAAIGELETPDVPFKSAGKGSLDMPKQFALYKARRNGAAIDLQKRPVLACAAVMNRACDQFLPGAGFAIDQHGGICR